MPVLERRQKGLRFQILHFFKWLFLSDVMAVNGINDSSSIIQGSHVPSFMTMVRLNCVPLVGVPGAS